MIPGLVLTIAAAVGVIYFVRRLERRAYDDGYLAGQEDATEDLERLGAELKRLRTKADRLQRLVDFAADQIDPDDEQAVSAAVDALIDDVQGGAN